MRIRLLVCFAVLLVAVLASAPAWARPCCDECPSWPCLDPYHDSCARVCVLCGGYECAILGQTKPLTLMNAAPALDFMAPAANQTQGAGTLDPAVLEQILGASKP
ncbi:MAG TPA: hypothetical protein VF173_05530 [Thermoanaerobaculia bacterium]|nr:hypothetical protein [Thermoanaerobaculia bacterium]